VTDELTCPHCGKPIQVIYDADAVDASVALREELIGAFADGVSKYANSMSAVVQSPMVIPASATTTCTGLTALWCPIHGACTCEEDGWDKGLDSPTCPLHSSASSHPEG
jgi:hypothetical protein